MVNRKQRQTVGYFDRGTIMSCSRCSAGPCNNPVKNSSFCISKAVMKMAVTVVRQILPFTGAPSWIPALVTGKICAASSNSIRRQSAEALINRQQDISIIADRIPALAVHRGEWEYAMMLTISFSANVAVMSLKASSSARGWSCPEMNNWCLLTALHTDRLRQSQLVCYLNSDSYWGIAQWRKVPGMPHRLQSS